MAVKISSLSSGNIKGAGGNDSVDKTDKATRAFPSESASVSHTDTISLTGTAAQLQQLENHIANMSVVDAQLVQEVQRKLATGNFRINPESAATKLLTMETSLP